MTRTIDLRSSFKPVRTQGARMSCLACAATDAHAHMAASAEPFSAEYLFYHAVQNMPGADPSRGTN
ncbi:MAG: hypothetical protein WA989_02640, partial [Henriciella sp.]